jgi:hypothetical protein
MKIILEHFSPYVVDSNNNDVTRLSRFPGVTRSDSHEPQVLLSLETGLKTYGEWEREIVIIEEKGLPVMEDMFDLLHDLRAGKMPEPAEVIQGVAHVGGKLVFGGASKAKKTWALADLAASVVGGGLWLDRFPCNPGPVLYLNMELPRHFMTKRVDMILKAKGLDVASRGLFKVLNLRGYAAYMRELREQLEPVIADMPPFSMILLDPTYKCFGGDELSTKDVAAFLNEVEKLAVQSGALIAFGSHFAKGKSYEKNSIDRISGTGVFARDPDSIITMTDVKGELWVDLNLRNHMPVPPFVVQWETPIFKWDKTVDPGELAKRYETKSGPTVKEIKYTEARVAAVKKFIGAKAPSQNELVEELIRIFEVGDKLAREKVMPGLEKHGLVINKEKKPFQFSWK